MMSRKYSGMPKSERPKYIVENAEIRTDDHLVIGRSGFGRSVRSNASLGRFI